MSTIQFKVNGKICSANASLYRETTLYAYLRYTLGLPGTKAMCKQGVCGSCIVTVKAKRHTTETVQTFTVNSCLVLVFSCHNWEITTVEGIGNRRDGYDIIQQRIAALNGTQCGYCTPGWVNQLNVYRDKNMTMAELEMGFAGNTCRCTGYRPILDTIKTFAVNPSADLCQKIRDIEDVQEFKCKKDCQRKCSTSSASSEWSVVEDLSLNDDTCTIGTLSLKE